jgi:hypothetical protein
MLAGSVWHEGSGVKWLLYCNRDIAFLMSLLLLLYGCECILALAHANAE